jgi:hypothetical protein
MCRKTAYTGNWQSKIFAQRNTDFICGKLNDKNLMP